MIRRMSSHCRSITADYGAFQEAARGQVDLARNPASVSNPKTMSLYEAVSVTIVSGPLPPSRS